MARLLKTQVQRRTDQIKFLILAGKPFQKELATLYTDLRLQAQYAWMVQLYKWLRLYTPKEKEEQLYHSALLQAFISLGHTQEAARCARILLKQNPADLEVQKLSKSLQARTDAQLPKYTPLISLSRYAQAQAVTQNRRKLCNVPEHWQIALANLSTEKLESLGYYKKQRQLARAPIPYRKILQHSFDELVLNFLFEYDRAVSVLAGGMIELLLALHLQHTLRMSKAPVGKLSKPVFDLTLHELIQIYSRQKLLSPEVIRLCRAARTQRNFIHPGKEFMEHNHPSAAGARVCFFAVMEVIDALL